MSAATSPEERFEEFQKTVAADARGLSDKLDKHRQKSLLPSNEKKMRHFRPGEVAEFLRIDESRLRQLAREGIGPSPQPNGQRTYSVEDIADLRAILDQKGSRRYLPHRSDGQALQVISAINFKGGSGKTTTGVHLAQYLALRGYRVLAIDLDPQASLTALFGIRPEFDVGRGETLYGTIGYDEPRPIIQLILETYMPGLHIIPGQLELQEFEFSTPKALRDRSAPEFYGRIAHAIDDIAHLYDVVIFDCPPSLGYLSLGAVCASTGFLVTIHPQMLDVGSMSQFLTMLDDVAFSMAEGILKRKAPIQSRFEWLRYLITRHEPHDIPQNQMISFIRSVFGERVLHSTMVKSTALVDAGLTDQTLYELDPKTLKNRGAYDRAMASMNAVNAEIESLIQATWAKSIPDKIVARA